MPSDMSDLPIIATLWVGGEFSLIEQLCLKSFVDHGHRIILYSYEPVGNCPAGVEQMDAELIFPSAELVRCSGTKSPTIYADLFKYQMIVFQNVIWVDADVLCMQPWDLGSQWLFGWEDTGRLVSSAVLGLPRFSRALSRLNAFCKIENPMPPWAQDDKGEKTELAVADGDPAYEAISHGPMWGAAALTYFLDQTDELQHVRSQQTFCPIPFERARDLLGPGDSIAKELGAECYGVHLWGQHLRHHLLSTEVGMPHPNSFLGQMLERHQINPVAASLQGRGSVGYQVQVRTQKVKEEQVLILKPAARVIPEEKRSATDRAAHITPRISRLTQSPPYQYAIDNLEERTSRQSVRLPAAVEPMAQDNILVLTSMKNEAPFILEWIAYHKAIGVKHFLVYTNDCQDNTNDILDALAETGLVTRVPNPWRAETGRKPQHVALEDAMAQPAFQQADWVLTIDVDEFVNIHVGEGRFADLFAAVGNPNVISFTWKLFGNGGVHEYQDRPIIEQFTACAPEFIPKPRLGWGFKSMVHKSAPYSKIGVHRPLQIDDESHISKVRWVNGSGHMMPEMLLTNNGWRSTKRSLGYRLATLNHYVLRSAESFLVKRDRGRINHTDQDQGIDYWGRRDYATETDERMHARLPIMQGELDLLLSDPKLAAMHQEAVVWHERKIEELKSDPDYAALYRGLTELARPDALYLTRLDEDEDPGSEAGVQIPEPEAELMTPEQVVAKTQLLEEMLAGKIPRTALEAREQELNTCAAPDASTYQAALLQTNVVPEGDALESGPQASLDEGTQADKTSCATVNAVNSAHIWCPKAPDIEIKHGAEPRFAQLRNHAAERAGFFWEGETNSLFFEPFGKRLVVSFENVSQVKLEGPRWPWGYKFLSQTLGCSVLGVMASKRNWYRSPFVHESFDYLRDSQFFQQFDEILFYGASMGGFGALTYSRSAPGSKIFAIAPQSTLDRAIVPKETRWGWTEHLDWNGNYADAAEATQLAHEVTVLYDPYFKPDVTQVGRLQGGNVRKLRMPFFGHQLPNALATMGLLKPVIAGIFDASLTDEHFYKLLRARRDLPRFQHDLLMKAEEKRHLKLAVQVCEYTLRKRRARNIRNTLERLQSEIAELEA